MAQLITLSELHARQFPLDWLDDGPLPLVEDPNGTLHGQSCRHLNGDTPAATLTVADIMALGTDELWGRVCHSCTVFAEPRLSEPFGRQADAHRELRMLEKRTAHVETARPLRWEHVGVLQAGLASAETTLSALGEELLPADWRNRLEHPRQVATNAVARLRDERHDPAELHQRFAAALAIRAGVDPRTWPLPIADAADTWAAALGAATDDVEGAGWAALEKYGEYEQHDSWDGPDGGLGELIDTWEQALRRLVADPGPDHWVLLNGVDRWVRWPQTPRLQLGYVTIAAYDTVEVASPSGRGLLVKVPALHARRLTLGKRQLNWQHAYDGGPAEGVGPDQAREACRLFTDADGEAPLGDDLARCVQLAGDLALTR